MMALGNNLFDKIAKKCYRSKIMLTYTELKPGLVVVIDGQPFEVLETAFLRMQQRKAVVQTKLKNLINGKISSRNIHPSETFSEAEVDKRPVKYLYNHRGDYWFCTLDNPKDRLSLKEDDIGSSAQFLKPNTEVTAIIFNERIINIKLPIKINLIVKEAPPGERGDTAAGGRKQVILETGAKVAVPLFINAGDLIKVNTETGEYVERAASN